MTDSVFPTNLDSFANPTDPAGGQYTWEDGSIRNSTADTGAVITPANPALVHEYQHSLANDAIAALQTKVGIDGSADTNSLDYKIAHGGGGGVSSVTGLNTDNTDPANPVIQVSVDGTSITGLGTPGSPLVSTGGGGTPAGSDGDVQINTSGAFDVSAGTLNVDANGTVTVAPADDSHVALKVQNLGTTTDTQQWLMSDGTPFLTVRAPGSGGSAAIYAPIGTFGDLSIWAGGSLYFGQGGNDQWRIAGTEFFAYADALIGWASINATFGVGIETAFARYAAQTVTVTDGTSTGGGAIFLKAYDSSQVPLTVQGASSQSGDLQQWQNSSATVGAHITAAMEFSNAPTTDSEVFGAGQSYGSGTQSVVIGKAATTSGSSAPYCIAIGHGATISGDTGGGGSIVIGGNTSFAGYNGTIIGNNVTVGAGNGVCVFGQGNSLSGGASLAIGLNSNASNFQARTIGPSNASTFISTTLIGAGLTATRRNETVFGDDAAQSGTGGWTGGQRIREMGAADDSNAYDMGCFTWTWTAATAGTQVSRVGVSTFYHATEQEGFAVQSFSDQARTAVGGTVISGQRQTIYTGVAADIGQVIQGASSQTGDYAQYQNSSGSPIRHVDKLARWVSNVVTAADATSVTPNSDTADITYQANTQTAGTLTINADGGTPINGQKWMFKIKSTNVQTYSWNGVFVSGSGTGSVTLPTASTGSSKIDNIGFIYDTINNKWMCVAYAPGY